MVYFRERLLQQRWQDNRHATYHTRLSWQKFMAGPNTLTIKKNMDNFSVDLIDLYTSIRSITLLPENKKEKVDLKLYFSGGGLSWE